MRRGYVTKWLDHRNFGFVSAEGGEDVFVHGSVLVGAASLAAGDRVEFAMQVQRSAGSKSTKYSATSCWRIDKEPQYDFTFPASDARVSVEHFMHMAGAMGARGGVDWDLDKTFHMMQPFIAFSSVNCPFLVISEAGLLEGVRAPSAFELSTLLQLLVAYAQGCSAARSFILADFEGEMLGYCGELSTAALLETWVVDGYLRPLRACEKVSWAEAFQLGKIRRVEKPEEASEEEKKPSEQGMPSDKPELGDALQVEAANDDALEETESILALEEELGLILEQDEKGAAEDMGVDEDMDVDEK
ncbi:unnamed protein product [Effrenium voratum]|nr:unnamed protein product [Effrenium voratum]